MKKIKNFLSGLLDDITEDDDAPVTKAKKKSDDTYSPILGDHLSVNLFRTTGDEGEPLVYIQFSGFPTEYEADYYAERIGDLLPLIFYDSEVLH